MLERYIWLMNSVFPYKYSNFSTSVKCMKFTVTVNEGKVRGAIKRLYDGSHYYSFKGIPYALPPIRELRYKAPLPPKHWIGVHEAFEHGPVCPQNDIIANNSYIEGDENCLFLNVYTKSLQRDSKLPVMFLIHEGGFMSGSGNSDGFYGPEFLLQHDVILVTFNYRLEVLGFLSLDTPQIPGNAGMKDQVAALNWVQKNIKQFGGDPDNVTLFGSSAGGISVNFHMFSPMSKGLFHKAISQGSSCIDDKWIQTRARERAFYLAKTMGKKTEDEEDLLDFLQEIPVEKIVKHPVKVMSDDDKYRGLPLHFVPTIEHKFDNVESFLNANPIDSILKNRIVNTVPLIIGSNCEEGISTVNNLLKKIDLFNDNVHYLVPREISSKVSRDKVKEIGERIKTFYIGNRNFTRDDVTQLCRLQGDRHFVYNIHRFTYLYSKRVKKIYSYKFCCDTEINFLKKLLGCSHLKGACHSDEIFYLFCNPLNRNHYESQDRLKVLVHRMTKLWTNFARTGDPTPDNSLGVKWDPYTSTDKEYLNIDNDGLSMLQYSDKKRMEFWDELYRDAGLLCLYHSSVYCEFHNGQKHRTKSLSNINETHCYW